MQLQILIVYLFIYILFILLFHFDSKGKHLWFFLIVPVCKCSYRSLSPAFILLFQFVSKWMYTFLCLFVFPFVYFPIVPLSLNLATDLFVCLCGYMNLLALISHDTTVRLKAPIWLVSRCAWRLYINYERFKIKVSSTSFIYCN